MSRECSKCTSLQAYPAFPLTHPTIPRGKHGMHGIPFGPFNPTLNDMPRVENSSSWPISQNRDAEKYLTAQYTELCMVALSTYIMYQPH